MPGSSPRRPARIAALVLGGALTLSACGGSGDAETTGSDATAAVVQGETITVGEVQTSTREVLDIVRAQAESQGQQPQEVTPDSLLAALTQIPATLDYAEEQDISVPSAAAVERQIGEVVPSPSPRTVDFVRASSVYSQLEPDQQQEMAEQLEAQDVKYSPRYATAGGDAPNWLEQSEDELPFETP